MQYVLTDVLNFKMLSTTTEYHTQVIFKAAKIQIESCCFSWECPSEDWMENGDISRERPLKGREERAAAAFCSGASLPNSLD